MNNYKKLIYHAGGDQLIDNVSDISKEDLRLIFIETLLDKLRSSLILAIKDTDFHTAHYFFYDMKVHAQEAEAE